MRFWYRIVAQVKSLVLRDRRQDELDEELRLHLEQDIAQRVARGMSPRAARQDALRVFGGVEKTKDECRDAWGLRLVDELAHLKLLGGRHVHPDEPDNEPLTDLATVYFGLGVFTANSTVRESQWASGGWEGWSVGSQGYLPQPVIAYSLALFAMHRHERRPAWVRHLRPDAKSYKACFYRPNVLAQLRANSRRRTHSTSPRQLQPLVGRPTSYD